MGQLCTMLQKDLNGKILGENSWDFKGCDTQIGTHGIHTYLAAMIPQIASRLIYETVPINGRVLDPFCGGGTVLVESIKGNYSATGIDINPLALIVSKAKTTYLERDILIETYNEIYKNAKKFKGEKKKFPDKYKVDYWFKDYTFLPLTALIHEIKKVDDADIRTFFECVFSGTVRDVCLTYRNEQRLRRLEPEYYERFNPDVFKTFEKRASNAIKRVETLPKGARADIKLGSVIDLPFEDNEFTNIICSPPYGDERNGVPYSQFSKNMLIWLDYRREDLLNLKKLTLGGKNQTEIEFKSQYLENELHFLTKPQSRAEAIAFYNDYYKALKEMIRVTSKYISIVIGNRTLQGRVLNNGQITIEFMENLGAKLYKNYSRTLPQKRLPKMGDNFGAEINEEDILIFDAEK